MIDRADKLCIAARYWLLGMAEQDPAYFKVVDALEFCLEYHTGKRNGGGPEYIHQLEIFHFLRTLHRHIKNPVVVYILAFLHDVVEDKNVSLEQIERKWGESIAFKLSLLSKEILGKPNEGYSLDDIFADEDASIVKVADRANNVSTMIGVFKKARLVRYVKETADEFIHRIKAARRKFSHQEAVYENAKLEILNQLTLIQHILDSYTPEE